MSYIYETEKLAQMIPWGRSRAISREALANALGAGFVAGVILLASMLLKWSGVL